MNFPPLAKRNNQDESDIGHSSDRLITTLDDYEHKMFGNSIILKSIKTHVFRSRCNILPTFL